MIQTARDFANSDMFDSRDVIETIESLEATVTTFEEGDPGREGCDNCGDAEEAHIIDEDDPSILWCGNNDDDERRDLKTLRTFRDDIEDYSSDWKYGATFIADGHFKQFAEQFADDIGTINDDRHGSTPWPLMHIDWEAAANDLKQDYTEVELLGNTFWVR